RGLRRASIPGCSRGRGSSRRPQDADGFVLTELAVVLCLDFACLAFAVVLARWTLGRGAAGVEARRLVNAATRAGESFLLREGKLAAVGAGAAVALILSTHGYLLLRRDPSAALS